MELVCGEMKNVSENKNVLVLAIICIVAKLVKKSFLVERWETQRRFYYFIMCFILEFTSLALYVID